MEFFIKRILKNHKGRTPFWDPKVAMSFMKVLGPAIYGSNNPLTHEGCGLNPCQMRFTHRKGEVLSSAASKFRFVNEDLGPPKNSGIFSRIFFEGVGYHLTLRPKEATKQNHMDHGFGEFIYNGCQRPANPENPDPSLK